MAKKQVQSYDPYIRDKSGKPIGTAKPPSGAFTTSGGETPPPTISGGETKKDVAKKVDLDPGGIGQTWQIGDVLMTKEEYEAAKRKLGFGRGGSGGVISPRGEEAVRKLQVTEEEKRLMRQEEILEREAGGEVVEELPPEQVESQGLLQEVVEAYAIVDTLGGLIPPLEGKEGEKIIQGTIPIGLPGGMLGNVKQGSATLAAAKATTSIRAVKVWNGLLKFMKTKVGRKAVGYTAVGYVYLTERKLANLDSALSQVRESVTIPVQLAMANPNRIGDAFDMITDLENDVRMYESDVKTAEKYSLSAQLQGRTRPIYQRIKKLDTAIDLARNQIARVEATGRIPTDEEATLMLKELNEMLDGMSEPNTFFGI